MAQARPDLKTLKAGGIIKQKQEDFFPSRLKVTLGELASERPAAIYRDAAPDSAIVGGGPR